MRDQQTVDRALKIVREAGYVALKEKSYRQAQERQRVAEALRRAAEQQIQATSEWAHAAYEEQRRLADRLTFVYGVARARGATVDELRDGGERS